MRKIIGLLTLIFIVYSCALSGIDRDQVLGTYIAESNQGSDTLVLLADSSYRHTFVSQDGTTFSHEDAWKFGPDRYVVNNYKLRLQDYILGFEKLNVMGDLLGSKTNWNMSLSRSISGRIYIQIVADFSPVYDKIE